MKFKQFIFTLVVMLSSFVMSANAQVAKIGEQGYPTLKAALTAATNGDIITLLANNAENVTIEKAVTIDGQGKTLGGTVTLAVPENVGTMKFNNVVFKTTNNNSIYVKGASYNVTFDACTFNGAKSYAIEIPAGNSAHNFKFVNNCKVDMTASLMQISGTASGMLVDGMHIVKCSNGFKVNKNGNAITFNNVTADDAYIFIYGMGYSDMAFVINNCTINAAFPFVRQDKDKMTYTYTFTGKNVINANPDATAPVTATEYNGLYIVSGGDKGSTVEWNVEKLPVAVTTKAELNAAIANAVAGDVIKLTSDINYGTDQLKIEKKITLDLGGNTLTTGNAYGGMSIKNGATVKNGNIVHTATVAAIKVWNATAFENLTIEVPGVGNTEKVIGGIVIQEGSTVRVDAIKNVTIKGAGLTNGIQTYNCGTAKENVIGSMENVNIDAVGVAMNVYAPCGTATNCTFKGGNYGIEIWIKGNYNASLDLVDCEVVGGECKVFAHDEFHPGDYIVNCGELKLTADAATGLTKDDVKEQVMHHSNFNIVTGEEPAAQAQTFRLFYTNKASESVAKIGEQGYETLAAAIAAAKAGETITFLADITEDVTLDKAVTIDGAGKTYTGKMTVKADATIKNVNFDGKGYNGYAVETRGAQYLTIEDCTAANYGYGFVQLPSATALTTVKNVTVSNMNYGVKVDYSNAVVLDNVNITAAVAAVLNSNYGKKNITIKNSELSIYGTYTRNNTIETNIVFEGANTIGKFIDEPALDKYVLAVGATLTAPEGKTVATEEGYEVKYENGIYKSVEKMNAVAKVGEQGYATLDEAFAAAIAAGQNVELVAANYEAIAIPEGFTGQLVINGDVVVKNANGSAITGKVINISGNGTLTAIAAGNHAYGIGGDNTESITIKDVHIAKVQGGHYGKIGTDTKYYKDAPEGGAAIGSGYNGAVITLTNVKIDEALGGSKAAGIGALYHTGVTINITGCTITKVEGGATAAAIGGSRVSKGATASEAVTINIQNSKIDAAVGGVYAAGIGSGYDTHCQANQPICTINIDGSTINAQGGQYAAGVGTGYHNAGLAGEIKNSKITAVSGDKVYKDKYTSAQDIGFGVADLAREGSNNDSYIVCNGTMIALPGNVAKIGETGYKTLAEAIAAATAGQTITFVADITEDVTVSKAVTIDGAGKTYTGAMTLKADATIKNVNFDGKGYNGYAITTRGAQYLTIEACTAKNYGYGFVQLASATALTTVKNVTVSEMNYGVKVDYSGAVVLENVDITAGVAAVLNSNYGGKTITINNSKLNILGTWTRNDEIKTTYVFEGANAIDKFITDAAIDNFKLAAGATLTAPNDITVTTVEGYEVKYENGVYTTVEKPTDVAKIGETGYKTLAEAITAATAGQTITFVADITEDVTVSKAVTIDGAGKTYTGAMTLKADVTIKNVNFDGKGFNGYAITTRGAQYLTIEACTAKNYGYGFVQLASATALTTVKNVTVSEMNYGVKVDYSGAVVLENVDMTAGVAAVLNSNYGEKTITINGSKLNILGTWTRNDEIKTNYVFKGANTVAEFITDDAIDNFKLAAGATLTAPEGKTVTTVDGYEVEYENGVYTSVQKTSVAKIGEQGYDSLADALAAAQAGQTITLLADIESSDIITINKAITLDGNGKKLTSTAGRAINIETEGKVVINNLTVKAAERAFNIINKPATVELNVVTATANNNAVMIATSAGAANVTINGCDFTGLAVVNVAGAGAQVAINNTNITNIDANKAENYGAITVYSTATNAKVTVNGGSITVEDDSKEAYIFAEGATVTGVKQIGRVVAMIGDAGYETLTKAIADAKDGQTVKMVYDVTMKDILVINKAITLDGNGKTLTSTAGRAINVSGANGVTIKNLTINAKGERAINVIQNATNVTIEKVTATAYNYTVNVAGSAANAVVAIKNSTLNGLCTVNVAAAGAQVTVDNSTVNCNDNNTTAGESYAALSLNKEAVGGSIVATNTTVNVAEGSDSMKGRNGAEDGTVIINGSTDDVAVMVAAITYAGSDYYHAFATIDAAIDFAKAGETIGLLRDVNLSEILVINKAITLDGNEKTLTSTAGRAINVSGADGVTIKDLTINAKGERAINVIQNATNVTIDNVTATAYNYTVNVAGSAANAVVAINNSTLNGLCTVNVAAANANVTVDNSTVNCNDNNTTAGESYAALSLNKEAVGGSIVATSTTVNVAEGSDSMKGRNGAEDGTVTINGSTDDVAVMVAAITYAGTDNYHAFATLASAIEFAKEGDVITLIRNVTMDYNARDAYETQAQNVVIDGNGKTLTLNQKNSDWASFGLANDSKLVLKNMTIEKTGYGDTSGAWNTHAIIFSCPVEMTNVTVNNSVAVQAGATLNDVTINEANGFYGLWINGNGQEVTVNGGAINATNGGRGIKIADQYIDEPAQVTLTVNDTKFNTAKKAAVLVSSKAGAQITASNVDITKVAEDKVNFVWVDEDWAQYFANVEVTGAKVRAEGVESFAAAIVDGSVVKAYFKTLAAAVEAAEAGATVELLADVTLEGGNEKDAEAGLVIDKELILDGKEHTINCGTFVKGIRIYNPIYPNKWRATFQNVTIVNDNANGRCIDTRNGAINLSVLKSSLIATNGNSQPLTIGGSEAINSVTLSNHVTIDAGNSGYAVINFVPAKQFISTAGACEISGYAAFYCKADDTRFNLTNTKITGKNVHSGETNGFGAIVLEGNNNTVNLLSRTDAIAITEGGAEQAAILVCGNNNTITMEEKYSGKTNISAEVNTQGENAYWTMVNAEATGNSIVKYGENVELVAEANGYQFVSFEEAVRFAKNGGEIKLLSNVALDTKNCVTDCGGYSSIFNVKGMELTFDLNGHTITVDADAADLANAKQNMLMGVFTVDDGGKLTIDDSSEAKTGAVNVYAHGATVYSLAAAYGKGAQLTINNGSFFVDEMPEATSLIYAQYSKCVIINGGTYNIGNVGTLKNASPWIFNTKGQNMDGIYVYGGTYPTDINHQFWFNEAIVPSHLAVKANEDGTWWTVVEAVAYTSEIGRSTGSWRRNVGYATIEEAIAATQSRFCEDKVTLAKNVEIENTITVANGVAVTLDLNGKTITGTDNAAGSYALITNKGNLTIEGDGAITLKATQDRDWNAYSSVISNTVGGKLTVNGGTIEHLGGTDMAYGIDNLTNGKGTYAETEINGGVIKSTYRAIRMFLNGIEAQNILTVNGGTIEGANKSIWMQDPSANANTGKLYVGEKAVLNGDVYLTVTAGSTQWPVEAYIAKAALNGESTVLANDNVSAAAAALVEYDTFWQVEQKNLAELTIVDEDYAEYINKVEKTVGKLTYVRTFENTEWQTLYLPFEVPVEALTAAGLEAAYIYNASYKNGAATIDHVEMTEGSLAANYPYFVRATEAGVKSIVVENATLTVTDAEYDAVDCSSVFEKFTFTGTYNVVDADNLDANKGHFVKEDENWETMDEVYAFRVYLTIELRNGNAFVNPQAIRMRSVNANGETTGIDGVDAEQAGDFIFDLHGRRVLETEKGGIYIKGGKKFIAQ